MRPVCDLPLMIILIIVFFALAAFNNVFAASSITPPTDYYLEESIWIKEHGFPASTWAQFNETTNCLNLSDPYSKIDLAYVIRSQNPNVNVNATFILYRNSDTKTRFLDNGSLLQHVQNTGFLAARRNNSNESVLLFWSQKLTKDYGEYHIGYTYYLFLTTFDPKRHSGVFQLRVNVSGLSGGSSWQQANGNPRVPWMFFRLPSNAETRISPFTPGEPLRASLRVNVTGSGLPALGIPAHCPYEVFLDNTSWANGTCYGSTFFRNGSQLTRGLVPGRHTITTLCGEVEAFCTFQTFQWDVELQVSPNITIPGGLPVCIEGHGFPTNESFSIFLGHVDENSTPILSGAVSKFGNFSAFYSFPKNTSLGIHNLSAIATKISGPPTATAQLLLDPWSVELIVSPTKLHQGEWLKINGSYYPPGAHFEIYLDGSKIHQGTVDENGTFFHMDYTLISSYYPGNHTISANATDYGGPPCGKAEFEVLQYDARMDISPNPTHPGTGISVCGHSFPPNEIVHVDLDGHRLGEVVTNPNGWFELECFIPEYFPLGNHTIVGDAPRYTGPTMGNSTINLVQWPIQVTMEAIGPHPGGWVRLIGHGFPPDAAYEAHLNSSLILSQTTSPSGEFDAIASLPSSISLGSCLLDVLVPAYSGPPRADFMLDITGWSPSVKLDPESPRPGEVFTMMGHGYPRARGYSVQLDGDLLGTGTISNDGTIEVYFFPKRNITLGLHSLNIMVDFPNFTATIIEFVVSPWVVGLDISPKSGISGTSVKVEASGCPPGSLISIHFDDDVLFQGCCSTEGSLVHSVSLVYPPDDAYHVISVECDRNYTGPPSAKAFFWLGGSPPDVTLSTCDYAGETKSTFFLNETVYAKGSGLPPSIESAIYFINSSLLPSQHIPPVGIHTDSEGTFLKAVLENASIRGEFGLWLDVNANGVVDGNDILSYPLLSCRARPQIALISLGAEKCEAIQGEILSIQATVENRGKEPEDAIVLFRYGQTEIGSVLISQLPGGSNGTASFEWNTASASPSFLTLKAEIDPLPGEVETDDNQIEGCPVIIIPAPDIVIVSVIPDKRRVKSGSLISVDVTIRNLGASVQEFQIELVWGDLVVLVRTIGMASGSVVQELLGWNTTGMEPDERRIGVRTVPIPFEKNTSDNDLAAGNIEILPPNTAPTALPGGPFRGLSSIPMEFDASPSYDDDGEIVTCKWLFGDGLSSTNIEGNHTYACPGSYSVQLVVTDDDGASSDAWTTAEIFHPLDLALWSSDDKGEPKNRFDTGERIFATIRTPAIYSARLYIISQGCEAGLPLKDISGAYKNIGMAGNTNLLVWEGLDIFTGSFDMVLDLNSNGIFEPLIDPFYSSFVVVGEGGLWVGFLLGILFIIFRLRPAFHNRGFSRHHTIWNSQRNDSSWILYTWIQPIFASGYPLPFSQFIHISLSSRGPSFSVG